MKVNENQSDVNKLLKLKDYEQPDEVFFEDFLSDFQARQRKEMLQVSARSLFFERLMTFIKERNVWQWGAVTAIGCATIGLFVTSHFKQEEQSYFTSNSEISTKVIVSPAVKNFVEVTEVVDQESSLVTLSDVEFVYIDLNKPVTSNDVEF